MKRVCISIFSMLLVFCAVDAKPLDSILTAASFPKNADDLTFRQRMDVLTDGYEDFDTEFDSNGVCIKNCPYVGMTLKDFEKRITQTAQEVQQDINDIQQESVQATTDNTSTNNGDDSTETDVDDQIAKYLADIVRTETGVNVSNDESALQRIRELAARIRTELETQETTSVDLGTVVSNIPAGKRRTVTVNLSDLRNKIQHYVQNHRPSSGGNNRPPVTGTTIPTSCPLRGNPVNVSSEMGYRDKYKRNHNGMDLPVSVNTPVYAAADGVVVIRRNQGAKKGYGNYLVIQHDKNYYTVYGHLNTWLVSQGQRVRAGQEIAKSGNTGHSTGPHLHFEVLKNAPLVVSGATPVDPRKVTKCPWNPATRR
ncbi:MAG: peptidoglycan DD-metalloendopeptidase family protein [Alphaproteobacteria bacterium]|nr:peptidoglycan DD-metalloendopeptidase family protein [Alphaproteobacteria bacterium]